MVVLGEKDWSKNMLPIVQMLASQGLNLIANAVMAKGQEVVEEKLGVKLDTAKSEDLRRVEIQHEEFLIEAAQKKAEAEIAAEQVAQVNVTDRWKSDMLSDSWLSKNVRPMTLLYWTGAISMLIVLDSTLDSFKVKQPWIDLIQASYMTILAAYFIGRTVQHVQRMRGETAK